MPEKAKGVIFNTKEEFVGFISLFRINNPEERIVFAGCQFKFHDFSELDLTHCDFENCIFRDTCLFSKSDLSETTFTKSIFNVGIYLSADFLLQVPQALAKGDYRCGQFYLFDPAQVLEGKILSDDWNNPDIINCHAFIEGYEKHRGKCAPLDATTNSVVTHFWNLANAAFVDNNSIMHAAASRAAQYARVLVDVHQTRAGKNNRFVLYSLLLSCIDLKITDLSEIFVQPADAEQELNKLRGSETKVLRPEIFFVLLASGVKNFSGLTIAHPDLS